MSKIGNYFKYPKLRFNLLHLSWSIGDILRFSFYTIFFSVMLFAYGKANSPITEWEFNSAANLAYESEIPKTELDFDIWTKSENRPLLSIWFNPDYIKIDDNLMKSLKLNIESKYFKDKVMPLSLLIDKTRTDPRWQVTWWKLILSWNIKGVTESIKVFVHELGHIIDLNYLGLVWDYDPSERFYTINWLSYNVKKKWSKLADFVSWYALTNKYEDFAESFTFYVFHNEEFAYRAKTNTQLARKYAFLKNYVFSDWAFKNTSFETLRLSAYNWDTTKIYVNLKKYLYYIH